MLIEDLKNKLTAHAAQDHFWFEWRILYMLDNEVTIGRRGMSETFVDAVFDAIEHLRKGDGVDFKLKCGDGGIVADLLSVPPHTA